MRLSAIRIEPNGNMTVIGGPNGAGKTSALDCIEMALGGGKHICDKPLKDGAESGYIILETEKLIVKRMFTEAGSTIKVSGKDGFTADKPQTLLDALLGDLSFDPLAFTRLDAKKQVQMLMRLLKLDFSESDYKYSLIETERRDIGRDRDALKAQAAGIPHDPDAPKEEVVVSELVAELQQAQQKNQLYAAKRNEASYAQTDAERIGSRVADLERQLSEAKKDWEVAQQSAADAEKALVGLVDIDLEPIKTKMADAESINTRVRQAAARRELGGKYTSKNNEYDSRTKLLAEITASKQEQIANAKFPVEGVTFTSDGILVNGIPFNQASSAEQLKIAVAMGLSANPELRIVLVRDGSLLDEQSMAAMAEMAVRYDASMFVERVGTGKEVSVVIMDGREVKYCPCESCADASGCDVDTCRINHEGIPGCWKAVEVEK